MRGDGFRKRTCNDSDVSFAAHCRLPLLRAQGSQVAGGREGEWG